MLRRLVGTLHAVWKAQMEVVRLEDAISEAAHLCRRHDVVARAVCLDAVARIETAIIPARQNDLRVQ